ncbi:MAG: hypothetical protein CL532_01395 [Aestuariivita sp.]|nr:hypothetical protein [Aestuariivita sp.]|tara:strand:- start:203 stop:625 length:423 start_codon:yes stop_codon:yes gene_type:complete
MALYGRDAQGNDAYIRATGAGTTADGYLTFHDSFSSEIKFAKAEATNSVTTLDVVTGVTNKKIRVLSFVVSCTTANATLQFQDASAPVQVSSTLYLAADSVVTASSELGLFETEAGETLKLARTSSAAAPYSVMVSYREV